MNGASITTSVADSLYPPVGHSSSLSLSSAEPAERRHVDSSPGGALAAARDVLARELSNSGFTNLVGTFEQNFATFVDCRPPEAPLADLTPGALDDLMAQVKSEIETDPEQAVKAQARVPPEAAVKLLT